MRSLTQVRRLQLQNGWTVTAPNGLGVEYDPRHVHDHAPFRIRCTTLVFREAAELTAVPPKDQPLTLAITMWRHTPMYHVVVANGIAACGRDELEWSPIALSDVPADSVCPICRLYTGIPHPPRPERQWVRSPGDTVAHIAIGEWSTACALYCAPEDRGLYGTTEGGERTADSDLASDVVRCTVCVVRQNEVDRLERWRYL